jgi:hypothetical protein
MWRLWFYEVKMMRPKVPRRLQRNTRREPKGEEVGVRDKGQAEAEGQGPSALMPCLNLWLKKLCQALQARDF